MFRDATHADIDQALKEATEAFPVYRNLSLTLRSAFIHSIAHALRENAAALIATAGRETHLPDTRLSNELHRTVFQLVSYANAAERGDCFEPTIDTADPERQPPRPDIRKILVPLGPVAVFGAANFPFAYSTAGGDTASALAAGCPVVVKAHPAHPQTSHLVAELVHRAVQHAGLPPGVFRHLHGAAPAVGKYLVEHPRLKAVGFTGSLAGGRQLYNWAAARPEPIPVFAEMSSVNPVYLLPGKLQNAATELASQLAASITLGVGQFCTNPGLIIAQEAEGFQEFLHDLGKAIRQAIPGTMLHAGIAENYRACRERALTEEDVHLVAEPEKAPAALEGAPALATVSAGKFIANPVLREEVFGPFSLVVRCRDQAEMLQVASAIPGQLTATLMATGEDLLHYAELTERVQQHCGRLILNGVPTGVEVTLAMHHGGPYPASTDARFGAVGADALKRFLRPLAFQQCTQDLLPELLRNENPSGWLRRINGEWTRASFS